MLKTHFGGAVSGVFFYSRGPLLFTLTVDMWHHNRAIWYTLAAYEQTGYAEASCKYELVDEIRVCCLEYPW